MNYTDFNNRMVHDGKRNNREVEITCERCGEKSWQRWQRVKKKLQDDSEFFCSRECHTEYQRENVEHVGYENARLNFDKSTKTWKAYWWEDGELHSTTGAKWLWEMEYGEIPDGYVVTYKDRNPENCKLENLELMTRGDRTSEALMGHEVSDETRKKMSKIKLGKPLSKQHRKNISRSLRQRWDSGEFDTVHKGKHSKFWRGGVEKRYPPEFSDQLKRQIKERDHFSCRICHEFEQEESFHIHHIDCDVNNNDKSNLMTVCRRCHLQIHGNSKAVSIEILAFRSMLKY